MYGGDEVSAIVIDLGSHTCKAGYAGEDSPKAVFPSVVGSIDTMEVDEPANNEKDAKNDAKDSDKPKLNRKLFVGSQSLGFRRDHMEVLSPLKDGVVVDWDIADSIWDHALRTCLLVDPKEHPMLLAEPSTNIQQQRERTAEIMFEKYNVPALFLAKNAVLTSFASGRATSLVVDCGGGSTTIAPVHDGYVLQKAVTSTPVGGEFLTDCLMKSLESKGIKIKPRYSFKRKEIRPGDFQSQPMGQFKDTMEEYRMSVRKVELPMFGATCSATRECRVSVPSTQGQLLQQGQGPISVRPYKYPHQHKDEIERQEVGKDPVLITFGENYSDFRGLFLNRCLETYLRELVDGDEAILQLKHNLQRDMVEPESALASRVISKEGHSIRQWLVHWKGDLLGGAMLGSMIAIILSLEYGGYETKNYSYK
ncbi:hypothetical protein K2173_018897 [Erythroxylum novogranatense]|uniref:Actin-related protein 4 n=1 Tax=Erythroxylum novogranatense TaxID=1862640 RepID=A0AAV8SBG7_9ROSI|nr:hypothetical protein K2173_018897 [Erythroxylum novogranatense]